MKDSLKRAIDELVFSSVEQIKGSSIKRIVLAASADREKLFLPDAHFRDPTEVLSYAHNRFLSTQLISDRRIRIEIIPKFHKERGHEEGDYTIYILDYLESSLQESF